MRAAWRVNQKVSYGFDKPALHHTAQVSKTGAFALPAGCRQLLLVLDAERSGYEAAGQRAALNLRVTEVQVALFRALGGGWEQKVVLPS